MLEVYKRVAHHNPAKTTTTSTPIYTSTSTATTSTTHTVTTITATKSPSFPRTRRRPTHQNGDRLGEADGVAQVAAERPVLQQQCGDERERHAEKRHEQVTDGHVHDEQIGDRVHLRGE